MKTFDQRRKSVEIYMKQIKRKRRRVFTAAVGMCLVAAICAMVLLIPTGSGDQDHPPIYMQQYAGSEYYELICSLDSITTRLEEKNDHVNNSWGVVEDAAPMPGAPNDIPQENMPVEQPGEYVEVTDNQVFGVMEGDIFKRSTNHVYYLRGSVLSVYSVAGEDSSRLGRYEITVTQSQEEEEQWGKFQYGNVLEMYLSADCRTVTVVMQTYYFTKGSFTHLVTLDVSDPANIVETNRIYFTGRYVSSRMVDDQILLTCNYAINREKMDFSDPTTFVPQHGQYGAMDSVPGENIVCNENTNGTRYTVVSKVAADTLKVQGSVALLGYSQQLYVSEDTIYTTCSYTDQSQKTDDGRTCQRAMTEITGISYTGDGLEILGTIALEGAIKDQFSMDQFDGILRIVTSTNTSYFKEFRGGILSGTLSTERNVNLYCIDLDTWQLAASVIAFAPEGEDAQSVRFDGIHAYVCTAEVVTMTDPVYFFDLSDLHNITWTDTGTIDGFSTSLIDLGEGYLMGVGYGAARNLKIEIYEEYDGKVISVCDYERDASFSTEYKSYLVDREHDLIGLAVDEWNGKFQYVLLHFDGYQLNEIAVIELLDAGISRARAFIADGWLYVLSAGSEELFVEQIW